MSQYTVRTCSTVRTAREKNRYILKPSNAACPIRNPLLMRSVFLRYDVVHQPLLESVSKKRGIAQLVDSVFSVPTNQLLFRALEQKQSHLSPEGQRCGL